MNHVFQSFFFWNFRIAAGIACVYALPGLMFLNTASASIDLINKKVTPSHVYAQVDLLDRVIDTIIKHKKIENPTPVTDFETSLEPMHVYLMAINCFDRLNELAVQNDCLPIPQVTMPPQLYTPAHVSLLSSLMLQEAFELTRKLEMMDVPKTENTFMDKKPGDVYHRLTRIFGKLNDLTGHSVISPNEVYAQVVRAVADAKAILVHIDSASRYRTDSPTSKPGLKPKDVFMQCLSLRKTINQVRAWYKLPQAAIPTVQDLSSIRLVDVFIQTQVIIAEMNLVKLKAGTDFITPAAISVSGKTPSDVHQKIVMVEYLLKQIQTISQYAAAQ